MARTRKQAMQYLLRYIDYNIDKYVPDTCGATTLTIDISEDNEVSITVGATDKRFMPTDKWEEIKPL